MEDLCNDALRQILLRMPLKELTLLKCTSKGFHSLISNPAFMTQYNLQYPHLLHVSVVRFAEVHYFPLGYTTNNKHPLPKGNISILASCNGLFFFQFQSNYEDYYLYNPKTKQQTLIPDPKPNASKWFGLVVDDPLTLSLSHHKVVCIFQGPGTTYRFMIFSGETKKWGAPIEVPGNLDGFLDYFNPFYIYGALHWVNKSGLILAFHVEREEVRYIEIPNRMTINSNGVYLDKWFGIVDGLINMVLLSTAKIIIWVLHDYSEVEWQIKREIQIGWNSLKVWTPLFFNGEHLVMGKFQPGNNQIVVYDTELKRWKLVQMLNYYVMVNRHFIPYDNTVGDYEEDANLNTSRGGEGHLLEMYI